MNGTGGLFGRARRLISRVGAKAPLSHVLSPLRRDVSLYVLERYRARAALLGPGLAAGDGEAREQLAALAETALSDMRRGVAELAGQRGLGGSLAARIDAWWQTTDAQEYLDDPALDRDKRVRILAHLDSMNYFLDSYSAFWEELRSLLRPSGATRILDLAAGHAGFTIDMARRAAREGISLELTASDIKGEYLDLGATQAKREQLEVEFLLQDALDLSNLDPGHYDVITCTQTLHHFSAGAVAVMFSEAGRTAARGVLFIDGARGALVGTAVAGLGLIGFRDTAFAHDTLVSFRRFFVAEELQLLANLTPWTERVRVEWIPPGHCLLSFAKAGG